METNLLLTRILEHYKSVIVLRSSLFWYQKEEAFQKLKNRFYYRSIGKLVIVFLFPFLIVYLELSGFSSFIEGSGVISVIFVYVFCTLILIFPFRNFYYGYRNLISPKLMQLMFSKDVITLIQAISAKITQLQTNHSNTSLTEEVVYFENKIKEKLKALSTQWERYYYAKCLALQGAPSIQVYVLTFIEEIMMNKIKRGAFKGIQTKIVRFSCPKTYRYLEIFNAIQNWEFRSEERDYEIELCKYLETQGTKVDYTPGGIKIEKKIHLRVLHNPLEEELFGLITKLIETVHLPIREFPKERVVLVIMEPSKSTISFLSKEIPKFFVNKQVDCIYFNN